MIRSLHAKLALWLTVSLILVFGGIALISSQFPRYLTEEYVLTRLEHDGDGLRHRLILDAHTPPRISAGPIAPIYETRHSGHYYQIDSPNGSLSSRSLDGYQLRLTDLPVGTQRTLHIPGPDNQTLLLWAGGFEVNGTPLTLGVAEDVSHIDEDLRKFQLQYLIGVILTLALLLGIQALVIRVSLRPLEQARRELSEMAAGQRQSISAPLPREIKPLVQEINRLGEVTRRNIEKSRNALGNLAHALKTPLAAMTQLLEHTNPNEPCRTTLEQIRAQSLKIQQTIERELKRSRVAGTALPGQHFTPASELPPLIQMLERIYANKDIKIHAQFPSRSDLPFDRADMLEILGNLLDNACKWATHTVKISLQIQQGLALSVCDDGPGIPASEIPQLTTRGQRLDESTPGHGLGLSIVCEIVTNYRGQIQFTQSTSLGGLKVQLHLPLSIA